MRYFIVDVQTEREEVGNFPQVAEIDDIESCNLVQSHKKKFVGDDFPPVEKVGLLELSKSALLTNVLSSHSLSGSGIICDVETASTLQRACSNTKKIDLEFRTAKANGRYCFLYKKFDADIIDYDRSTYSIVNTLTGSVLEDEIEVDDLDAWGQLIEKQDDLFVSVLAKKVVLKREQDWIKLPFSNANMFSEKLVNELEEMTGASFRESSVIVGRSEPQASESGM